MLKNIEKWILQVAGIGLLSMLPSCGQSGFVGKGGAKHDVDQTSGTPGGGGNRIQSPNPNTGNGGNNGTSGSGSGGGIDVGQSSSTEQISDLIIKYAAFTDGDGDPSVTATQNFDLKGPNDSAPSPLKISPFVPTNAAQGQIVLPGACRCGQDSKFDLIWHASGSGGTFNGNLATAEAKMFRMGHALPKDIGGHWNDQEFLKGAPSGANTMYISDDHPFTFLADKCSIAYFYCGDTTWNSMDDVRLIFSCDVSKCQPSSAASTTISFVGQESHLVQ